MGWAQRLLVKTGKNPCQREDRQTIMYVDPAKLAEATKNGALLRARYRDGAEYLVDRHGTARRVAPVPELQDGGQLTVTETQAGDGDATT
jgi:hypothetical protein